VAERTGRGKEGKKREEGGTAALHPYFVRPSRKGKKKKKKAAANRRTRTKKGCEEKEKKGGNGPEHSPLHWKGKKKSGKATQKRDREKEGNVELAQKSEKKKVAEGGERGKNVSELFAKEKKPGS